MNRSRAVLTVVLTLALAPAVTGCGNTLAFGTATKFGLDISQRPDQAIDVTMGYDRYEVASIPADGMDATRTEDAYSVLGNKSQQEIDRQRAVRGAQ